MKSLLVLAVLLPFTVFSTWVVIDGGYLGFVDLATESLWGLQVFIDLCIALSWAIGWMVQDARKRGARAWPWVLLTLGLGSIGPLSYLLFRELRGRRAIAHR